MAKKRRIFSAKHKTKVALEAIKGQHTIAEIAHRHKLHATQINLWKKQLLEGAESVFEDATNSKRPRQQEEDPKTAELYEQIGRLNVQLHWLKKKVADEG